MKSKKNSSSSFLILFPLSIVSVSVHAGIIADCNGSSYCTNKTIDANYQGYIDKTPVYFLGDSRLTISAPKAFNDQSGVYEFRGNTNVDVNASLGLNGGSYTLRKDNNGLPSDSVHINVSAEDGIMNAKFVALEGSNAIITLERERAINGGSQVFNAGTTLNINSSNGILGSDSFILTGATLNLNATEAIDETTVINAVSVKGDSRVNINTINAITGGQLNIQNTSKVNIDNSGSVSGGTLLFTEESELNVQSSGGITGDDTSRQIFQNGTTLNVNAQNGITGGYQLLNNATLNVNSTTGISGGKQTVAERSVMNLNAIRAITDGNLSVQDRSTMNANEDDAIIGGTQRFKDDSTLNANGQNVLAGGVQYFSENSVLNGNNTGVINGNSRQIFLDQSVFNVDSEESVTGGLSTIFKGNSIMNLNKTKGVVAGNIVFDENSILNVNAENAITGGVVRAKGNSQVNLNTESGLVNYSLVAEGNSSVNVNASNALTDDSDISLQKTYDSTTGANLNINGVSLAIDHLTADEGTTVNINGGLLTLLNGGFFSGLLAGDGDLDIRNGMFSLKGDGSDLIGNLKVSDNAKINFSNNYVMGGNIISNGTINFDKNISGRSLTVNGNYVANNANLILNTVLEGDDSASDKLIVHGNTSGETNLIVHNISGKGAQTNNGIEVVHVDGQSDGEFSQTQRLLVGAWDYILGRGQGDNNKNWYLTSVLRPEVGSYIANIDAVNNMFVTGLHDRLGKMQYIDVITGEQKETSMWMRHEGGHYNWRDSSGQTKTQSNRYVLQLGGDFAQWSSNDTDRWHMGFMAGYGNEHSSTDSGHTGYRSKGNVNGYSTGLYTTWYADDKTRKGAYLDNWVQYSWFDNQVNGDGLQSESYKSKGFTASIEGGYTWEVGQFAGSQASLSEWFVQPQVQVVWMDVKADEHHDRNGSNIESIGDGNIHTRLGVKTWIKGHNKIDDGKSREFNPFIEANWLHNTRDFSARIDGLTTQQAGSRNIGEVKVGLESQITSHFNMWGNIGVQVGDKGYNNTSAVLGLKYTF